LLAKELFMHTVRAVSLGVFGFAVLALLGCDGVRMADISGSVKYDGQPVDDGAIQFAPADGQGPSAGGTIKAGQYNAKVPIGNMKVTISWPKGTGVKKKLYESDPKSAIIEMKSESLPEKYTSQTATELSFEVKSGSNRKDWELTK
jgi:hypothetical protein